MGVLEPGQACCAHRQPGAQDMTPATGLSGKPSNVLAWQDLLGVERQGTVGRTRAAQGTRTRPRRRGEAERVEVTGLGTKKREEATYLGSG